MVAGDVNPYQLFARARAVWSAQRYPSVVDYTLCVRGRLGAKEQQRHYHEFWFSDDNRVVVQPPVSDEQLADPYKPSPGVSFEGFWNIGGPRQGTGVKSDLFNVPALAPNYSFGIAVYEPHAALTPAQIVQQIRAEYHDPAAAKVAQLEKKYGLKTIALVTSTARDYRITLVGIEQIAGHPDYHLALQPVADPQKYRLRDMWIQEASYLTDRLRVAGNFEDVAMERVPWLVQYQTIGGVTYLSSETAQAPLQGYRSAMYDAFSISFQNYSSGAKPFWFSHSGEEGSLTEP